MSNNEPGVTPNPQTPPPVGEAKQTFTAEDVERMKANWSENIARHEEKATKAEKALEAIKAAAAKKEEEARQAQMSEVERANAKAAELESKLKATEEKHQRTVIESEIKLVGLREGANDVGDLMALIGRDGITTNEDGSISGIEEAVKALKEKKPYLFAAPAGQQPPPAKKQQAPIPNMNAPREIKVTGVSPLDMAKEREARNRRLFAPQGV